MDWEPINVASNDQGGTPRASWAGLEAMASSVGGKCIGLLFIVFVCIILEPLKKIKPSSTKLFFFFFGNDIREKE